MPGRLLRNPMTVMLLVSVALAILFFNEPLLRGGHIFFSDFTYIFHPYHATLSEAFSKGVLPLWNPYNSLGFPFIGDPQSHVLYPPAWVFFVLPFNGAYPWFIFLHYCIAAVGMFCLLRRFGLSDQAAFFGGIIFGFNGYMISDHLYNHHFSAVYMPFVFCGAARLRERPGALNVLIAAIPILLQITAGELQHAYFTLLLLAVFVLAETGKAVLTRSGAVSIVAVFIAGALALALASPYLLSVASYMGTTERFRLVDFNFATQWSVHPLRAWSMVAINPFGYYEMDSFYWLNLLMARGEMQPSAASLYMGVSAFVMILYSARKRDKKWYFFAVITAGALFLAAGAFNPLFSFFFYHFPLAKRLNFPFKYLLFFYFSVSFLAARGVDTLLSDLKSGAGFNFVRSALPWMGGAAVALIAGYAAAYLAFVGWVEADAPIYFDAIANMGRALTYALCILCMTGAAIFAGSKAAILKRYLPVILVIILATELYLGGRGSVWSIPAKEYHKPAEMARLISDDDYFGASWNFRVHWGRLIMPEEYAYLSGPDRLAAVNRWKQEIIQPNINQVYGLHSPWMYISYLPAIYNDMTGVFRNSPHEALDMFNVGYLYTSVPLEEDPFYAEGAGNYEYLGRTATGLLLYRNSDALPRAYLAAGAEFVNSIDAAKDVLLSGHIGRDKPATIVGSPPRGWRGAGEKGAPVRPAKIVKYSFNSITMTVDAPGDSALVVLDSYNPDWQVRVDGRPTELFRANYFFRGVCVPAGRHEVSMVYRPRGFSAGLWVAVVAAALWAIAMAGEKALRRGTSESAGKR